MADHFLPPVNRSMKELDRTSFQKTVPLAAAYIQNPKAISAVRNALTKSDEMLRVGQIKPLQDDPSHPGAKALILQPQVDPSDSTSWSSSLQQLVEDKVVEVKPFNLQLSYNDWTMRDILDAILPILPEEEQEHPSGFAQAGHVAHLNLRPQYLPYKHLIGQVLLDKSHATRTVINKTLDVGTESVFRTFPYEVLAGPDDLDVTIRESGCEFKFNFGKVYWNSRLGTEHERLVANFKPGEALCDVMAGVGPFAIPAGKNRVFVHANDLNPDSFASLQSAISRNKVLDFVKASCTDGRAFIHQSAHDLLHSQRKAEALVKKSATSDPPEVKSNGSPKGTKATAIMYEEPPTFDHYVMNLPGSAVEFLDAFRGIYHKQKHLFESNRRLPLVHVYLFQRKCATESEEHIEICKTISHHLGTTISIDEPSHELALFYVRLVSPKKKMYCASFRLPASVAFAEPTVHQSLPDAAGLDAH